MSQVGKVDAYRLLNKFHITHHNSADRGFEIQSLVNLEKRPHSLSVSPNLFPDLIGGSALFQHVDFRNISTENHAWLLSALKTGNFTLHPSAIVNYHHNSLESRLDAMHNYLTLDYLDAGLGAEMVYSIRKFHASLYLPLKYRHFRLDNRVDEAISNKSRLRMEPNLSLSYKINSSHNLKAQAMPAIDFPAGGTGRNIGSPAGKAETFGFGEYEKNNLSGNFGDGPENG